jgi:hypothetical protein
VAHADHGYEFKTNPVLEPLDHIECRDALLVLPIAASALPTADLVLPTADLVLPPRPLAGEGWGEGRTSDAAPGGRQEMGAGSGFRAMNPSTPDDAQRNPALTPISGVAAEALVTEAPWPKASVVIGNPPFLGDKKMRAELGDAYTTTLRKVYEGRVPGGADLVCYWFEKARAEIESNGLGAAGLVATNSIRGGKNRVVLDAIARTTRIFEAWSDEGWVNDGAAVRVSLVAFGSAGKSTRLDGHDVELIEPDLSAAAPVGNTDMTTAIALKDNKGVSFQGPVLVGDFEINYASATEWLRLPNPNGRSNAEVVRPLSNGKDITSRSRGLWVVDFDARPEDEAALFEKPFEHVVRLVKPMRDESRDKSRRIRWWLHGRSGTDYRAATKTINRYIATSQVAKHRVFVWLPQRVWPHQTVIAIARADDTIFGILQSRFHELWSLRMGTSLGVGNDPRYTPTTCFETFPFPAGLTPADTAHQRTETLEGGAVIPANWGPEIRGPISPEALPTDPEIGAAKSGSDPKSPAAVAVEKAKLEFDPKFPAAATVKTATLESDTRLPATVAVKKATLASDTKLLAAGGPTVASRTPAAAASKGITAARTSTEAGMGRMSGAISKSEAYEPPASAPSRRMQKITLTPTLSHRARG